MDAVFAFPGCCPSPQMESLVMRKIVGVGWREGSGRRAGGGSPAWSDINAKERSSLYARRRIHPAPDSIKTDLSPCETRCEDEGAEREREREREGGEGNRVEKGSGRSGKYISRRDVIPGTLSRGKSRMPRN